MSNVFLPPGSWRELRDQVFTCVTNGDHAQARRLLCDAIPHHGREEQLWIWLAKVAISDQERRAALERALQINPFNEQAKQGLRALDDPAIPGAQGAGDTVRLQDQRSFGGSVDQGPLPPTQPLAGPPHEPRPATQPLGALGAGYAPRDYAAGAAPSQYAPAGYPPPGATPSQYAPAGYPPPGVPPPHYGYPLGPGGGWYVPAFDRGSRPGCITATALLFLLGPLLVVLGLLILIFAPDAFGDITQELGAELGSGAIALLGVFVVVAGGLALATSVGLWRGARYGWWMAGIYAALTVMSSSLELATGGDSPGSSLGQLLLYGAILAVLLNDNTLRFFQLMGFGKGKALAIFFGAGVGLVVVLALMAAVLFGGLMVAS